jgi:hypothetical protein
LSAGLFTFHVSRFTLQPFNPSTLQRFTFGLVGRLYT